jgi:hypothetical protein
MKAYIFSIGEPTLQLCEWSLKRLGFETIIIFNPETTLWAKLKYIYSHEKDDFLRVDADIIVNRNVLKLEPKDQCWWHQSFGYDWFSQDIKPISVNWIKKEAIPYLKNSIEQFENAERPESQMFRLEEFHSPRRCEVYNLMCGLHGWNQKDIDRVQETKERRRQDDYDFELVKAIGRV